MIALGVVVIVIATVAVWRLGTADDSAKFPVKEELLKQAPTRPRLRCFAEARAVRVR